MDHALYRLYLGPFLNRYREMYFNLFGCIVLNIVLYVLILWASNPYLTIQLQNNCLNSEVSVNLWNILKSTFTKNNNKIVYYGVLNESDVVIKEYVSSIQCDSDCVDEFEDSLKLKPDIFQPVILCPTTANFQALIHDNSSHPVLIESLLMQVLPFDDGWPLPKLYGQCDNKIITEYVGTMLTDIQLESWEIRVELAIKLLKIAEAFTFKHPTFSFYFTDMSPDNIAVKVTGALALIDLDNVIIVDRHHNFSDPAWEYTHTSEVYEDEDTFTFSPTEICRHHLSDFNYYAVCKHIFVKSEILGTGILMEIPDNVQELHPNLTFLRDECAVPHKFQNRIGAAQELEKILLSIFVHEE